MTEAEEQQTLIPNDEEEGMRLDAFVTSRLQHLSRAQVGRAIQKGGCQIDGQKVKPSLRIKAGMEIRFTPPDIEPDGPVPENIPLDIIFEDEFLVAINKPPNMVVHPARGHWSGTLTSALAFHFEQLSSIGGPTRPGIVHRLDRDTSGVIVVAKTDFAHMQLCGQFENRTVQKQYVAIVLGRPDRDRDIIDQPIGNHPYQREKKAIRAGHSSSRPSQSFYEVRQRARGFSLVQVAPKTGRTHQIRLHLAHIGHPVLCDRLYGGKAQLTSGELSGDTSDTHVLLDRQALHAEALRLSHPKTDEELCFQAPFPDDMQATWDAIVARD